MHFLLLVLLLAATQFCLSPRHSLAVPLQRQTDKDELSLNYTLPTISIGITNEGLNSTLSSDNTSITSTEKHDVLPTINIYQPPLATSIRQDIERRKEGNETFYSAKEGPTRGVVSNCKVDMAYSFDDGPHIWHQQMADVFAKHGSKYTSFVNGRNWGCIYDEVNVQALRRDFLQGHLIGSHTWSHAHLNSLTHEQTDEEIEKLEEALWKILGIVPAIIRPPYGECDGECVRYLNERHGLTVITWDVDSGDSVGATSEQCQDTLRKMPFPGPHMPLSHETYEHSATDIPDRLLPVFKTRGYDMKTVSKCLEIEPYKVLGTPQQRDSTWSCI